MQIVIDMDEEEYQGILNDAEVLPQSLSHYETIIKNGKPISQTYDVSQIMYEIYMEGVNMSGEYQGCWVRFKDIERIMDKYVKGALTLNENSN